VGPDWTDGLSLPLASKLRFFHAPGLPFGLLGVVGLSMPVLAHAFSGEPANLQRQHEDGPDLRQVVRQLGDLDDEKAGKARATLRARGPAVIPVVFDECHRSVERAARGVPGDESAEIRVSDDEVALQGAMARVLQDVGRDAVPQLRALVRAGDSCRHVALWALEGMDEAARAATPEALASLTDPDPVVRRAAVELVAHWCPEMDDRTFTRLLRDQDVLVRNQAVSAAVQCGVRGPAVGPLVEILLDGTEHVWTRQEAARALGLVAGKREDARRALEEASHDDNIYVRYAAERELSEGGGERETCAQLARTLASNADERSRAAAARALGALRGVPECAVEALLRALREDEGFYIPDEALKALGELGPLAVSAVDDLILLERPEDAPVDPDRVRDTLVKIGPGGIPRLVYHLRMNGPSADEDTIGTWGLASAVLRELGKAPVPELAEALWDPTRRNPALITLRALGPAAEQAIPDLVKLYRQDPTTRWGVLQALYAMGGKACPARDLIEEVQRAPDTREADRRDAERALTALASCPVAGEAADQSLLEHLVDMWSIPSQQELARGPLRSVLPVRIFRFELDVTADGVRELFLGSTWGGSRQGVPWVVYSAESDGRYRPLGVATFGFDTFLYKPENSTLFALRSPGQGQRWPQSAC
jgi:hypothetical protein